MPSNEQDRALADHGDTVWRLIVRILGTDGQDAADCFQQTFFEFYLRQSRQNDVHNIGAMLRRIATARSIDMVRCRIRDRQRTNNSESDSLKSPKQFEPDFRAEERELLDDLRGALVELPEQQAVAFVLTQIEDLPHEAAARALGVTVNHIGVLLHRARVSLQERLESHNPSRESLP